jgi:deoxyribodipyrimidine photolyase
LGSDLVFRRASESKAALLQLAQETGAEAVVFNHLYDPISLVRDNEVKTALQQTQVQFFKCCTILSSVVRYMIVKRKVAGSKPDLIHDRFLI